MASASIADAVRTVGGAGDSRYKLCSRSRREVWCDRAGNWNDGQAGSGALDCAVDGSDSDAEEEQGEGAVAMVHPLFLHCCCARELCPSLFAADCRTLLGA